MSIIANNLLQGDEGYNIARSLRLRSSASAYLSRTPASAGNQQKWTWSGWAKLGAIQSGSLFGGDALSSRWTEIVVNSSGNINIHSTNVSMVADLITTQVFRDPSSWYHVLLSVDTTQATASNRITLHINGKQVTSFSTATYPAQNTSLAGVNQTVLHTVGKGIVKAGNFDGYLADTYFIDGQALTPSSFGSTNSQTGVWQPKKYAGTYGTNGFYLPFSDNTSTTTLGYDKSGNSNNWTTNNISLTAGSTYDSMVDVPTLTSATAANYAVLNPLVSASLSGGSTLSNGNLRVSATQGVSNCYARSTIAILGKMYAEFYFDVVNSTASIGVDAITSTAGGLQTNSTSVCYRSGGNKRVLGTETAYGASWVANDIIGVAVDTNANTIEFFKNGTSQGVITSSSFFSQGDCVFAIAKDDIGSPLGFANFGQRPFAYTPPTGFVALNVFNLPEPSIKQGNKHFDATTYTGNGTSQSIVNAGGFQPDFVWAKSRSNPATGIFNTLIDSVRGLSSGWYKALFSNSTDQEDFPGGSSAPGSSYGGITSLNSNGFTLTGGSLDQFLNKNTYQYIAWQWKANGTGSSNTAGTITSTVSANPTAGFSVVTYTGTGANATVGHGLGVAPSMVIVKKRSAGGDQWYVYHASNKSPSSNAGDNRVFLNLVAASNSDVAAWNNTNPTSSVFSIGTSTEVNGSGATFVAYCFASVSGYSVFGSYTGNGSTDGVFIYTGFRPKFVLAKRTDSAGFGWHLLDSSRNEFNVAGKVLIPNSSAAESDDASNYGTDFLSNGFKSRTSATGMNASGGTYIYMAFAENPFKYSLAR